MIRLRYYILVLLAVACLTSCKDIYKPVYYPNKDDLTKYIRGPEFVRIEDARNWVYEQNKIRGDQNWDYEIGKNPRPSKYGDIEICEETLK